MDKPRLLTVGLLLCICTTEVTPQRTAAGNLPSISTEPTTSNYYFAGPNEVTIIVNVLGYVQRPGRYEISSSIDLINLIALAGGPAADGALDDVKLTRVTQSGGRVAVKEIHLNLDATSKLTPNEMRLLTGDVVQVDRTGWSGFRDIFTVVVGGAIVTTAIARVLHAMK